MPFPRGKAICLPGHYVPDHRSHRKKRELQIVFGTALHVAELAMVLWKILTQTLAPTFSPQVLDCAGVDAKYINAAFCECLGAGIRQVFVIR